MEQMLIRNLPDGTKAALRVEDGFVVVIELSS